MLQTILQIADAILGFPTGFDVIADLLDQYIVANKFVNSLKLV